MTYLPRVAAAKSAEWHDLAAELDRWEEAGLVAPLWWRDDDAVAPTPQLDRLLALADGAPLALAVIPADVVRELAAALEFFPRVTVLHHGWRHANHAAQHPGAGKKSEYPAERHPIDIADELVFSVARIDAIDADVDHHSAGLDPVGLDEFRLADGGDQDVGAPRDPRQIAGARMRHGHGGIGSQQQLRRRLAKQKRAADHQHILAGYVAHIFLQQQHHARRRAGDKMRAA